ncbi:MULTISPECIES: TrgA family protein [Shimia]|uniref:TrgA family protein n=1 Tax=Shimia TaxID=573139 RepID=UPI001FB511F6|nr:MULTISPECIES: TrgA family protein [Shimia]MDV4144445.1 TrgA family protein [Shimia sp. FJ5]
MPTGPKLVGAVCLAILAALVAELTKQSILAERSMSFGYFTPVSALVGGFVGWRFLGGTRPEAGLAPTLAHGFSAVILMLLLGLFVFGCYDMLMNALDRHYRDVAQALRGIIDFAIEYTPFLMRYDIIVVLFGGALVSGVLTGLARRHWR